MRIELTELGKRFGRHVALREVTLQIASGSRVALVGPNGSGKSTLTRALMGLLGASGTVRIDGRCPFRERVALARRMAYVPQIAPRLSVPVRELVRAVVTVRGLDAGEVARVAEHLQLDTEPIARQPFRDLSGGMKQKLLIALALAGRAELLILDEPTASLDAVARQRFFELCEQRGREATLLLCSHRLEEIRHLVDEVVALAEGRVRFRGAAAELLGAGGRCEIEVRAGSTSADAWLADHGLTRGVGGWWTGVVRHADKMPLLRALPATLGEALLDLRVRDLERIAIDPSPEDD